MTSLPTGNRLTPGPESRPTLTAALVVQNEATHLSQLLPRLRWADEVLVVDGGSSDATATVARELGARVVARPFDHFAAQRNFGHRLAQGDWLLWIDADERPQRGLEDELRRVMVNPRAAAYRVPIRSRIFGRRLRFSGTQGDRPVRFMRRDAGTWVGNVHEAFLLRADFPGRGVGQLRCGLDHETLPEIAAFLAKMHRYTQMAALARVAAQRPPRKRDRWWAPCREVFRRLIWKHGWLDGPQGWLFCGLSGLSEWVLAERHARYWAERQTADPHRDLPADAVWFARWRADLRQVHTRLASRLAPQAMAQPNAEPDLATRRFGRVGLPGEGHR